MRIKKRLKKARNRGLTAEVQVERTELQPEHTLDGVDSDILSHISQFLSSPLPKLEQISLMSREEALDALAMLDRTQKVLETRIKTARMLRQLAENSSQRRQ